MVTDAGCERIHKEKKVQKVKMFFFFYFPKRGNGLGVDKCTSPEQVGLWALLG